jgi:hypothetical protein
MRNIVKIGLGLLAAFYVHSPGDSVSTETLPAAAELLNCSIAYHDPGGRWQQGAFEIIDVSSRPDGSVGRRTILRLDNARGLTSMEGHVDGHVATATIVGEAVQDVRLDDRSDFSAEDARRFQLSPAQLLTRRNFFIYLLGLPMKLRDPGTVLDPVARAAVFQGSPVHELRVTYEQGVGSDTWYFYLDPRTCALVGHRFYHDEAAGDGEYTVLSGEVAGEGLRLPRQRKWHRNRDDEWFITHTIESIGPP